MPEPSPTTSAAERIPAGLRLATAYAWRLLLLGVVGYLVLMLLVRLEVIVLPIIAALLLAALLDPVAKRLRRTRIPNWVTAALLLVAIVGAIVGVGLLVVPELVAQFSAVNINVIRGIQQVQDYLADLLPVSQSDLQNALNQAFGAVQSRIGGLVNRAIGAATFALQVVLGIFAALFLLFFFIKDGERFHRWMCDVVPPHRRQVVEELLPRIWKTLRAYVLGVMIIGFLDALGIGIALALIGVPLLVPLVVLTFFAAFFPIVGAIVAGAVAALVALVAGGVVDALLVVGAALLVQQLEGNVLQPLVMGHQVQLHPAVTLVSVGAGGVLAGIVGAFLAVPVVAVATRVLQYLSPRVAVAGEGDPAARADGATEVPERALS